MTSQGFLADFITNKTATYVEPKRKGTARGERIGFSLPKYKASLLCALTSATQEGIARALGVSYGLIRKWHTEQDFKEDMHRHMGEFRTYILERLHQKTKEHRSHYEHLTKKSLKKLSKTKITIPPYQFTDAPLYGRLADIAIYHVLKEVMEQIDGRYPPFALVVYGFLSALKPYRERALPSANWLRKKPFTHQQIEEFNVLRSRDNLEQVISLCLSVIAEYTVSVLANPKAVDDERKLAVMYQAMLRKEFERESKLGLNPTETKEQVRSSVRRLLHSLT